MKVYTTVKTHQNFSNIGVVLLSDKNDIYMMNNFQVSEKDNIKSHIYGIKRALSFVKNMKPLYAKNDMEILVPEDIELKNFQESIANDEYITMVSKQLDINVEPKENLLPNDDYFKMIAKHQLKNIINPIFNNKERE